MATAWIVAALLTALAAVAIARLPSLHPGQLWTVPWAAVMVLYAMRLLPYKDLQTTTAALIVLSSAAFVATSWWAGRRGTQAGRPQFDRFVSDRLWWTAVALIAAAVAGMCVFLTQIAGDHGVRAALVSAPEVRTAIQEGATFFTIKYVYVSFAAALVAGISAAHAAGPTRRHQAVAVIAVAALTTYPSTSRSSIFLAALIGGIAYLAARKQPATAKEAAVGAGAVLTVGLAALLIGGAIIGKTFEASELSTIDSPFTRHDALEPLASPYQYATAPVGALNELVAVTPTIGGDLGCATVPLACDVGGTAGLGMSGTNPLRPFTARPLRWNTYTGLDGPLMDGGVVLTVPIIMLLGALAGVGWARARTGSVPWLIAYSMLGAATVLSTGQNRFFAYHFLGAPLIAVIGWYCCSRLNVKRGTHEASA